MKNLTDAMKESRVPEILDVVRFFCPKISYLKQFNSHE